MCLCEQAVRYYLVKLKLVMERTQFRADKLWTSYPVFKSFFDQPDQIEPFHPVPSLKPTVSCTSTLSVDLRKSLLYSSSGLVSSGIRSVLSLRLPASVPLVV